MNSHLLLLPLLLALLFTSTPTDGAKQDKSKIQEKSNNKTQLSISVDNDIKKVTKEAADTSVQAVNNATKSVEKASYPKKVHALKKRPTKTPTIQTVTATALNGKSKRKKVLDVTTVFKDLPADDVEFIKELDKQFQLHGDKIKIKVEHDNSTETEKQTSKRTIDGELGYGSYHSQNGYHYERPKFMFYPYSQRSIPADAPGYYPPKTDVSIEPSYSYELQPETYVQEQEQHTAKVLDVPHQSQQAAPQQEEHGGYEEPVIVLRIPGPTKYASHLQTLLQQYLEIRAAQYLRLLEEADKQQQHQQQQQQYAPQHAHQQQQQEQHHLIQQQQHEQHAQHVYEQQAQQQHAHSPQQAYVELQPPAQAQHEAQQAPAPAAEEHGYSAEVNYAPQVAPASQAAAYPEIDQVYHSYKGRLHAQQAELHQQHQQHLQEPHYQQHQPQPQQHQPEQQVEYAPEAPQQQQVEYAPEPPQQHQVEYAPQQQAHVEQPQHEQQYYVQSAQQPDAPQYYYLPVAQVGAHGSHHYQNIYFMAIAPQDGYNAHAVPDAPLQHQPIYVQEDEQNLQQQNYHAQQQYQHKHTTAAENNPRQTHTKVIYTHNAEKGAADYAGGYTLPSIRPYERHAGTSPVAAYHQQQQQQQLQEQLSHEHEQQHEHEHEHEQQQQYDYETQSGAEHDQPSAAISPRPFNYHAHSAKPARRRNRKRGAAKSATTKTSATTSAPQVDEHLQKINEFVRENLGAKMSTAVEFKTAAVTKS